MGKTCRLPCLALVGAVVLLLIVVRTTLAAEWVDHKSDDGGYSARFPDKPKTSMQTTETAKGKVDLHMAIAEQGSVGYTVMYAKFPPDVELAPADKFLEGAEKGIESRGITFTSRKKATLGDYTGLELKGTDGNGLYVRVRLFKVKTTLFQILVTARKEKGLTDKEKEQIDNVKELTDDTAEAFVKSFKLLDTPSSK